MWIVRVGGQDMRTTPEHPFWVQDQGWRAAGDLRPGDRLASHDGSWAAVEAVHPEDAPRWWEQN